MLVISKGKKKKEAQTPLWSLLAKSAFSLARLKSSNNETGCPERQNIHSWQNLKQEPKQPILFKVSLAWSKDLDQPTSHLKLPEAISF